MIYLLLVFLCLPFSAYAYLDPITGSMIVQGLIAAVVTGGYVIKKYWKKLISFFKKEESDKEVDNE